MFLRLVLIQVPHCIDRVCKLVWWLCYHGIQTVLLWVLTSVYYNYYCQANFLKTFMEIKCSILLRLPAIFLFRYMNWRSYPPK